MIYNCVTCTVLPAKSDSDVMFVYKVSSDFESIGHFCINPIRRIGLITNDLSISVSSRGAYKLCFTKQL